MLIRLLLLLSLTFFASCSNDEADSSQTNDQSNTAPEPTNTDDYSVKSEAFKAAEDALTTSTDNINFTNRYFGLKVKKPDTWHSLSVEDMLALQQATTQLLSGSNTNQTNQIEQALQSSLPLFGFYRFPPDSAQDKNSNILSVAENIKSLTGMENGCSYLEVAKEIMLQTPIQYKFVDDCKIIDINGTSYGELNVSATLAEMQLEFSQTYLAAIKEGYAISIIETYFSDEDKAALDSIVLSLSL